jgi:hypothetical protein
MVKCLPSLGVRLVVGQRTLTPSAEVRILDPQPKNARNIMYVRAFSLAATLYSLWLYEYYFR